MVEEWLVDGCNLLHAYPSGRSPKDRNGRAEMLSALAGFAALKGKPMLVVLDGKGESAELDIHHTGLFRVVYSQKVSADACIERLLFERRSEARFTVITDDRAISNIARGSGAMVVGTASFLEMLKESRKESGETLDKDKLRSHGFNRPFEDKLKDI